VLKAIVENVRVATVARSQFVQLQLDVYTLRREVADTVEDNDYKTLAYLFDEILSSGSERCPDAVQLLPHAELERLTQ